MRFRHGLETVDAFCWAGEMPEDQRWVADAVKGGTLLVQPGKDQDVLFICEAGKQTRVRLGSWIVRMPAGEIYACDPRIFDKRCRMTPRPPKRPDDRPRFYREARRRSDRKPKQIVERSSP
jgi:hypothetical protein